MIVRRFGASVGSVLPDFHAAAFNEVTFARCPGLSLPWAEFAATYERAGELALDAESEGWIKLEVEAALLALLEERLLKADRALGPDELLLIENVPGRDYPRTHEHTETLVEEGRNRFHFHYHIHPPLCLGLYRRRSDVE